VSRETRSKHAKEIDSADVIACMECGSLLWIQGLKVQEGLFGDQFVLCPHCDALLIQRIDS
jgi:hypothetical protein